MSAGSISGAAGVSSAGQVPGFNGFGELSTGEFVNVLIEELTNQDPFQPQDSGALLEQLSSLRNIESQMMLQEQLEALVLQNQVTMAGGLIGKAVRGLTEDNDAIDGLVTAVRVDDGKATLELDTGRTLPMDRVTRIFELDQSGASTSG